MIEKVIYPSRIKKDNLGDILINVLLIRELSKTKEVYLDGDVNFINDLLIINNPNSYNIKATSKFKKIDGLPLLRWFKFFPNFKNYSFVFDPPGHYVQGNNKIKFFLKNVKYALRAITLKPFNVRVVRLGVTLGPYSEFGWYQLSKLSKLYHNISVRDTKNYKQVLSKNLENVSLIDDLAFLYDSKNFITESKNQSNKIIISLRGSIEGSILDRKYVDSLIESIKDFLKPDLEYVLTYQVKEDLEVMELVYEYYKSDYNISINRKQLTFHEAINLYYTSKYVLTNRLHVALLALLNYTPAFVITDCDLHHKLVNVYKDAALEDFLYDINFNEHHLPDESSIKLTMENFKQIHNTKKNHILDIINQALQ